MQAKNKTYAAHKSPSTGGGFRGRPIKQAYKTQEKPNPIPPPCGGILGKAGW